MAAKVERVAPRKFRAWCPACTDGVNAGKWFCEEWAIEHNAKEHREDQD